MQDVVNFLVVLVIFLMLDLMWIVFLSKDFYKEMLGSLMKEKIDLLASVLFYLIYIFGILFFVIYPAIEKDSMAFAFGAGALFGLVCYSAYDLTNLATIKNWPFQFSTIDLIWGTVLTSLISVISFSVITSLW